MRGYCVAIGSLLLALIFPGCSPEQSSSKTDSGPRKTPYTIVTTCGMVTDIVRQVAGEHADVIGLMNEGVDPHLYKPTRDDMNTLFDADIVFYVGLMLEGRMTDSFVTVGRNDIPVYPVTEGLDKSKLHEPPEFAGHYDPHVWMDVSRWSACTAFVAEKLAEFDPAHADDYKANSETYRKQLADLNEYTKSAIATIPESQRVLITAHDAFGYFSEAYDIPVRALQGITTEAEASVDDVNQLVDFLVQRKIRAIFVESSVNQEGIKALLEGCASRGHNVVIGGELFSDAMGASGSYTGTYIGMMDHNATTITRALGGDVPADGFQGKLKAAE
ncbi:MAG: zinc ABC transporter substrate-binding protein [Planctomycetaceae bacterium]|nr:zinc ABC transporter substrate-binding protein [Planctomycetaceae bacterium]